MEKVSDALIFPKGKKNFDLTIGLNTAEFGCQCKSSLCHFTLVNEVLLLKYKATRVWFSKPLDIRSGYRCQTHNARTKNAVPNSYHTLGMAIDIAPLASDLDFKNELDRLEEIARACGFHVIRYETFIHCDVR